MEEKLLPIGTKVFDIRFGWGKIIDNKLDIDVDGYPYNIEFAIPTLCYTHDGKNDIFDINPTLSLTEYSFASGSFTPITEFDFDAPKIGECGYFWDIEGCSVLLYGKLKDIQTSIPYRYITEAGSYPNFSKDIPQWFMDKMNND